MLRRGIDEQGRFIGPGDARDFRDVIAGAAGQGGRGVPRDSKSGLTPANLREMHALRQQGKTHSELAAHFGVSLATIGYHFRKGFSVAMQCALRAVPPVPRPSSLA